MNNRRIFICILFFLIIHKIYSSEIFVIENNFSKKNISQFCTILKTNEKQLTIDDILIEKYQNQFILTDMQKERNVIGFMFNKEDYWIKFDFKNESDENNYIIVFERNKIEEVVFYNSDENNRYLPIITGDNYPFSTRALKDINFSFPISIEKNQTKTYYFKISSPKLMVTFPVNLYKTDSYYLNEKNKSFARGVIYGSLFFIIIISLFLYLYTFEKTYLYFFIYVFIITIAELSFRSNITEYVPFFIHRFLNFNLLNIIDISGFFLLLFTYNFLLLKKHSNIFSNIYKIFLIIIGLWVVISYFVPYPIHFFITVNINNLAIYAINLTSAIIILRKKYTPARFYLTAYIVAFIGIFISPLYESGRIQRMFLTENLFHLSFIGQSLLMVVAMLDKMKFFQKEKDNAEEKVRIYANYLEDMNKNLENLVNERTKELSNTLENLKNTQAELVQSEKMAALGQLVAGVAHEINTPLGAINASVQNMGDILKNDFPTLSDFFEKLTETEKNIFFVLYSYSNKNTGNLSTIEIRKYKRKIRQELSGLNITDSDYLADILTEMRIFDLDTQLKNSLNSNNIKIIIEKSYKFSNLLRNINIIEQSIGKVSKIVFALKKYAHYDQIDEMKPANIVETVETILILYYNQLKHGIEIVKNYESVPNILCYADELNQVWTNIIHNALQAMDYKGKLTIDIRQKDDKVFVSFTDTGKGIADEHKNKIFVPFFTTKPRGEGSGLGLDIVKKIIDKHNGSINFESKIGEGTTFTVVLPVKIDI